MMSLNEKIADAIATACAAVPTLTSTPTPTYLDYLTTRIDEVVSFWRSQGLEPEHVTIMGGSALLALFSSLSSYQGLSIDYVVNPLADHLSVDGLDEGTFTLDFTAFHPASTWIRPALGIAYPGAVDPVIHATRWVLQEIDGMDPDDAARASEVL